MKIYEESKSYIVDEGVETSVASIQAVLQNQKPYKDIPKLPALLDTCHDADHLLSGRYEENIKELLKEDAFCAEIILLFSFAQDMHPLYSY